MISENPIKWDIDPKYRQILIHSGENHIEN